MVSSMWLNAHKRIQITGGNLSPATPKSPSGFTTSAESVPNSWGSTQSSRICWELENTWGLPPRSRNHLPNCTGKTKNTGEPGARSVRPRNQQSLWHFWQEITQMAHNSSAVAPDHLGGAAGRSSWNLILVLLLRRFKEAKRQHRAAVLPPARLRLCSEATSLF